MMVSDDENWNNKDDEEEQDDEEDSEDDVESAPEALNQSNGIVSMLENMLPLHSDLGAVQSVKKRVKQNKEKNLFDEGPQVETGFSPLHLAILNNAHPTAVQMIVTTDPSCIRLKTSMGRTAQHCADYIVKQHWLYGVEDESSVESTLKSIEILEEYADHQSKS